MRLSDRYELFDVLVEDASGKHYRAKDLTLGRAVSVKVFQDDPQRSQRWRRFVRESRVLAALQEASLPELYDLREKEDPPYMVMAEVRGESLRRRVERAGPFERHQGVGIFRALCKGIAAAHRAGIVHRDLSPDCVFLDGENIRVIGFGRADTTGSRGSFTDVSSMPSLSAFLAPEVVMQDTVDARSDIYGIAALTYYALTGTPPFEEGAPVHTPTCSPARCQRASVPAIRPCKSSRGRRGSQTPPWGVQVLTNISRHRLASS